MFLGLDLGTTNVKAVVVDDGGRVVAAGSAPLERYHAPDGGVEQDIEEIWLAACRAIRQAVGQVKAAEIRALGVSSQGGAMQPVDANDRPVGRVISWLDGRGRPFDRQLTNELGEAFFARHVGRAKSGITIGQVLRLRQQAPRLLGASARIAYVGDLIVGRLCGRRAHDATSLSIAMLLNPRLGRADPDLLERLQLREDQLPELLEATTPAGRLRTDAAEQTGLPAGIPVSPAVHDQYAASIGAGSVGPSDVCLGTGTAWVLVANTTRLTEPVTPEAFVCPHLVQGLYGQMLSMAGAGSAIEWVMRLLRGRRPSAKEIDEMLEAVPPGSDGLCFWPPAAPVARSDPSMGPGGRLTGITLAHTPNHLVRAAVEGLACELGRHLAFLTDAGLPVRRLAMCGPAAASRFTPQIVADVVDRPVACVTEPAVSAFGAAVVARTLVDRDTDLGELARRLAPAGRMLHPGENTPLYRRLFERYLEPFAADAAPA